MKSATSPYLSWLRVMRLLGAASLLLGACTSKAPDISRQRPGPGGEAPTSEAPTSAPTDATEPGPEPSDEADCTLECDVPQSCLTCAGDVSCATPRVACNADGSCGNVTYVCASGRTVDPDKPPPDCQCEIPAICRLCDDGSCAEGWSSCNADGSCFRVEWDCGPCPDSWEICYAKCNQPLEYIPSHCPIPDCDCAMYPRRCDDGCAVPDICVQCGDDCAEPIVGCKDDSTCGEVTYKCNHPNQTDCDCPIEPICHLCSNYTCAAPKAQCNPDGSCGETTWLCPDGEGHDCDIEHVACDVSVDCSEGTLPTRSGDCFGPCVDPGTCTPAPLFDCDLSNVTCRRVEPECGEGRVPTTVDGCYGECVPPALCK